MATKIEWVTNPDGTPGETWNPIFGCAKVSAGCANCFAETMANRLAGMARADSMSCGTCGGRTCPGHGRKANYLKVIADGRWNGRVVCDESALTIPIHWWKPRTIFVCSMSDLYHPSVPVEFIERVWAVMALCQQHRFMVLTKRAEAMAAHLTTQGVGYRISRAVTALHLPANLRCVGDDTGRAEFRGESGLYGVTGGKGAKGCWPLPNVMLGVSCENQACYDERWPHLAELAKAGWRTMISFEPLIGGIDASANLEPRPDLIIVGGESGVGARNMKLEWANSLMRQYAAQTPKTGRFYKQTGSVQARRMGLKHSKGGDQSEWDIELIDGVREEPRER